MHALLKPKLRPAAGKKFTYGDDNYCLLAALIEVVAGQSYEAFLRTMPKIHELTRFFQQVFS